MSNKAGKTLTIFVILIFILLLSSTSIGFYLYHMEERLHKGVETELGNSRADVARLQAQLKDIQAQLALAQDKSKEADQKINSLLDQQDLDQGLRTALKKENAGLKEQMANLAKADEKIKSDLGDSMARLSQFQELLKASQDKTKQLEAANKDLEAKVSALKASGQSGPEEQAGGEMPGGPVKDKVELDKIVVNPQNGTKGHILSIDADALFVVFNLGANQGVKTDDMLSVYRGDEYLGDIRATRVQDEMAAADIIPPLSPNELRKNDTVILKP